tara:strand:- start:591 stop:1790 length:1200 start_codon:yes stop_codon:yes gene_type:complete
MASAIERLLFPEGNFQQIKATAPDQRTYNIEATKDLVENLPGGVFKDILAPATAGIMSPFYDAIQAATRMQPGSGVSGFVDAFRAENPLSSAFERMTGAAGPLYDRLSNFSAPSIMGTAQAATANPNEPLDIENFLGTSTPRDLGFIESAPSIKEAVALTIPDRNRGMEISEDFIDRGNPLNDFRVVSEEAGLTGGIPDRNRGMEINENFIDRGNPLGDPRIVSEEIGLIGGGRNPMAQFSEERRTKTPEGSFDEIYDTFRDNLRPPSKIDEGLATLLSLAGLVTGSTPVKVLGAGANIASGKAGRMLKGAKNFNQKIRQSDFGQSKSLADFLSKRKQRDEAASKQTRDEARKITQRISKQKPSPRDERRGSMPTRTSRPSPSRRSGGSYTEAARARRR